MDKCLVEITTFNPLEMYLLACALTMAADQLCGIPPRRDMMQKMYMHQESVSALMAKMQQLLEAASS